jgi:hypothetical protein
MLFKPCGLTDSYTLDKRRYAYPWGDRLKERLEWILLPKGNTSMGYISIDVKTSDNMRINTQTAEVMVRREQRILLLGSSRMFIFFNILLSTSVN